MSRFNQPSPGTLTTNLAGGEAFKQSPEMELVSILLTSFVNDKFYESSGTTLDRVKALIPLCDKEFVAKAAVYARTKFGMRSISHVVASELAKYLKGLPWAKHFYYLVVNRPDDITEILAYHLSKNGKESAAMKKGLGDAFGKFDAHQLAKYRGEGKAMKLVDAANLLHPQRTEKSAAGLAALVKGTLKSTGTWESELTKAGQTAESDEQKEEFKKDAWEKLIKEKKIGYFALLRNLRNIIEQAPNVLDEALAMLVDEKRIRNSLVLPFRFLAAYEEIEKLAAGTHARMAMRAIDTAADISCKNVPKMDNTLVVLDTSTSMTSVRGGTKTPTHTPARIGGLFAAALVKANDCDFLTFDTDARYQNLNTADSLITLSRTIRYEGGGTNFHSIFQRANGKYDRIIILSDMQGWMGDHSPVADFEAYKKAHNTNPFIYSFDLNGYGSLQFPENRVFCVAGFSEKVFTIMSMLEEDRKALINTIKREIIFTF